jgi:hypothetical protein
MSIISNALIYISIIMVNVWNGLSGNISFYYHLSFLGLKQSLSQSLTSDVFSVKTLLRKLRRPEDICILRKDPTDTTVITV